MNAHAQKNLLVLKWTTITTLLLGIFLHMSRFTFGNDALTSKLLTPTFEALFTIPLAIGCVLQLKLMGKIDFRSRMEKIVYYFCSILFLVSVPVHLISAIGGRSQYVYVFPLGYSLLTTIICCYFIYVFIHLKVRDYSQAINIAHHRRIHAAWFI